MYSNSPIPLLDGRKASRLAASVSYVERGETLRPFAASLDIFALPYFFRPI
jgi:hypothetical protein